jgi:hypothetical protein
MTATSRFSVRERSRSVLDTSFTTGTIPAIVSRPLKIRIAAASTKPAKARWRPPRCSESTGRRCGARYGWARLEFGTGMRAKVESMAAPGKQPEPRRHHYAPRCWLAGFTETGEPDGRLWVTDLARRKQWVTSPGNAGFVRDFYRLPGENLDPVMAEKTFGSD